MMRRRKGLISLFPLFTIRGFANWRAAAGLWRTLCRSDFCRQVWWRGGVCRRARSTLSAPHTTTTENSAKPQLLPRNPMIETAANISSARSLPFAKMWAQKGISRLVNQRDEQKCKICPKMQTGWRQTSCWTHLALPPLCNFPIL